MIEMAGRLLPLTSAVVVAALVAFSVRDCVAAGPNPANANQRMYEKYKSEQQKFLDDFDGASTQLDTHELLRSCSARFESSRVIRRPLNTPS